MSVVDKINEENEQKIQEKASYVENNYSNVSYVEIRYLEMDRELGRINTTFNELISALNSFAGAYNKLASLVDAEAIDISNIASKLQEDQAAINDFASSQLTKYDELNDEITERTRRLAEELHGAQTGENGAVYVYGEDKDGNLVRKSFQEVLKEKEREHYIEYCKGILTNSEADGYRVFEGDKYIVDALNVSEDRWENFETMYAYFAIKGLTDEQIAGIMANAAGESGFNKDAKNPNSTAQGFFQWLDFRQPENWNVETQLDHAWNELESGLNWGGTSTLTRMQNCTTPEQASDTFLQYFEGGGSPVNGPFASLYPKREEFARDIYNYIKKMKGEQ